MPIAVKGKVTVYRTVKTTEQTIIMQTWALCKCMLN